MEYVRRKIDNVLISWKLEDNRKPLLLRGARQVGKTSTVREFAKTFDYYIEIDFLNSKNNDIKELFSKNSSVKDLCQKIAVIQNVPIEENKTLLFFDEIQECPKAIEKLRYFYEEFPNLHVIAAGSLLEFALEDLPSFGVGRIRSIFMYPLSFEEFLLFQNYSALVEHLKLASPKYPLSDIFHKKLLQELRNFLILGGMPEVVTTWCKTHDYLKCTQIQNDLLLSYQDDFSKYRKRVPASRIQEVFRSVAEQGQGKFVYKKVNPDIRSEQIKTALETLILAGLVYPVTHTAANGIPLGAEVREDYRRMIYFDTGLLQRQLGLKAENILVSDDFDVINKGAIAEVFVGLELIKSASCYEKNNLYCWHREQSGSNAEVDFVIQKYEEIIPIEVKSSKKGSMQSLRQFLTLKQKTYGIRTSLENFCEYEDIKVYPLYAIGNILLDGDK
ncbi:MAG: ATP-binding protein [Spirochaetaceae bacterium]|nr:ATP-binding protein [Spirochaetaceae bacterium]